MPLRFYGYANCDTCRRAAKFLRAEGVAFEEIPIRERPPGEVELRVMLAAMGGDRRRLFNVSGRDYRELGLAARLPSLSEAETLALLGANGNLVKRPFLMGDGVSLVGFDEARWREALGR